MSPQLVIKLSLLQRHFSVFGNEIVFLDALVFDDLYFISQAFGPPSATGICIETFLDFNVEKRMPDRPQRFGGSRKKRSAGARYF